MPVPVTAIVQHDQVAGAQCFPCGFLWEEQWVGVRLSYRNAGLGAVCPRCLTTPPAEMAERMHDEGLSSLQKRLEATRAESQVLRLQTQKLLAEIQNTRKESRRVVYEAQIILKLAEQRRVGLGQGSGRVNERSLDLVTLLSPALGELPTWPIPLEQIMESERAQARLRYPDAQEEELHQMVDMRYIRALAAA